MSPEEFTKQVDKQLITNHLLSVDIFNNGLLARVEDELKKQNICPDNMTKNPKIFLGSGVLGTTSYNVCIAMLPHLKMYFEMKGWLVSIKYPPKVYSNPYCLIRLFPKNRINRLKVILYDIFDSSYWSEDSY